MTGELAARHCKAGAGQALGDEPMLDGGAAEAMDEQEADAATDMERASVNPGHIAFSILSTGSYVI